MGLKKVKIGMNGTVTRQVKRDEVFTVDLEEPSSAGYQWHMVPQNHIELVATTTNIYDEEPRVGSPVTKTFIIHAEKVGEYKLVFELIRPWNKKNPVSHHQVNIDVSEER